MKKVLAMLLVIVMVIGMMPLSVFAAETPTITLTPSTTDLQIGDTFTVSVDMTGNTGIAAFQMQLLWNADVVSLVSVDYADTILTGPTVNTKKCAFVWYANYNVTANGNIFAATFQVVDSGDCGIKNNDDYFMVCDEKAVDVEFVIDETTVSGLTVAAPHEHSYEAVVTAPTCTAGGYTTYTCACGDTYTADETAALGHSYTDGVCTVCGEADPDYVAPHEHSYEAVVTAPTCTEGGYTTYICACGDSYTADETEATGHCIVGGICTVCGEAVETAVYAWYEAGTENASYTISTAEELAQFAAIVNGTDANYPKDDFYGKTVSLASDIALAEDGLYIDYSEKTFGSPSYPQKAHQYVLAEDAPVWTPIGTGTATATYNNNVTTISAFAGTFDGNGHTVSGVYTGSKDASAPNTATVQGLFGIVTGTVKNLTVSGCVTGRSVVGGVVAYLNGGVIENCVNNAIVFSDGGNEIGKETGGIVGRAGSTASVTGCVNNATIICANSNKGGRVAGIIGLIDSSSDVVTVERNANYGTIVGYQYVAGIVGMNYSKHSPITSCLNAGEIDSWGAQKIHVGGIVGQFDSPVSDCYSLADIHLYWTKKTQYVGGIAGDRATYSGTDGDALTVSNCYVTGSIIYATNDTIGSIGLIAGDVSANSANNYYLDEGFAGSSTQCGAVNTNYATSMTADEMKSEAQVALLNGENGTAWKTDGNCVAINDGYPILAWQTGAADHDYDTVVTVPTCTEGGYSTLTCTNCGDSYVDSYVDALGHTAGEPVAEDSTEETCTEDGSYDSVVYCSVCGEELSRETVTVAAAGHTAADAVVENEIAATCTEDGSYDSVVYCTVCGEEISRETVSVAAAGHSYEAIVTAPTCTEQGYTTHTCTVCGDSYVDSYADALGHDYQDGACSCCGEEDPEYDATTEEPTEAPTEESTNAPSVKPTQPNSDSNGPKTGDNAQMMLWIGLLVLAMAGMAVLFSTRKKWMNI